MQPEPYGNGGILPHGPVIARNDSSEPEPVAETARCASCRRGIWRAGLDGAWRSEDGFGCPATGQAHQPATEH